MINAGKEEQDLIVCANCGIAGVDEIKLEECPECHSARSCGDKCLEGHRQLHEEECQRQKDELYDKKLFSQPDETHEGECPICFLPLPLDPLKASFYSCCSKIICQGCDYANVMSGGGDNCPFCREPRPKKKGEFHKRLVKRVKANDPAALRQMGGTCYNDGDYEGAFKYLSKAAELEEAAAHYKLGYIYENGEGVEKDDEKAVYHWEVAAMGGHPQARYNLAAIEEEKDNIERAVKHYIIAANIGEEDSMKELWKQYSLGNITKEELETTLRSHQDALNAMKSPQREAAEAQQKRLQR